MAREKSTPAPWRVMTQNLRVSPCDPRCPEQWQVPVEAGNVVALVYGSTASSGAESRAECLANAALIAEAPAMLKALKECRLILAREIEVAKAFGRNPGTVNEMAFEDVHAIIGRIEAT